MPFADPPGAPPRGGRHRRDARRVTWLFAYGSLLPAREARPCDLTGYRRSWGVAMDNTVDLPGYKHFVTPEGERPALMVAFLSIDRHPGAAVNGVALPVAEDELTGLDDRERNYVRADVTEAVGIELPGRVWAYVGLSAARARMARGRREGRLAIASSYHERVLAGFDALGQRERFERLTAPMPAPIVDLEVVLAAPRAEPGCAG
jgi:cation transport regulator ChaC